MLSSFGENFNNDWGSLKRKQRSKEGPRGEIEIETYFLVFPIHRCDSRCQDTFESVKVGILSFHQPSSIFLIHSPLFFVLQESNYFASTGGGKRSSTIRFEPATDRKQAFPSVTFKTRESPRERKSTFFERVSLRPCWRACSPMKDSKNPHATSPKPLLPSGESYDILITVNSLVVPRFFSRRSLVLERHSFPAF